MIVARMSSPNVNIDGSCVAITRAMSMLGRDTEMDGGCASGPVPTHVAGDDSTSASSAIAPMSSTDGVSGYVHLCVSDELPDI